MSLNIASQALSWVILRQKLFVESFMQRHPDLLSIKTPEPVDPLIQLDRDRKRDNMRFTRARVGARGYCTVDGIEVACVIKDRVSKRAKGEMDRRILVEYDGGEKWVSIYEFSRRKKGSKE